jgi:hypothetical protein
VVIECVRWRAMDNNDIILTLNGLLAHCRLSSRQTVQVLRRWGGQSAMPELLRLCERIAALRANAIADLQRMVVQSGGTPDAREATVAPPGVGTAATGCGGQLGALNAFDQIESGVLEQYRDALDEPLPALVRQQLERQFGFIEATHRELTRLREHFRRNCTA